MNPSSRAARVALLMRWSLYSLFGFVPLTVTGEVDASAAVRAVVAAGLSAAMAVAATMLLHRSFDHRLGGAPRPVARIVITAVLALATIVAVWPITDRSDGSFAIVTIVTSTALLTALDPLLPARTVLGLAVLSWLVAAGPAIHADSGAAGPHLGLLVIPAAGVGTARSTLWMVDVIRQLDEAQHVRAELAVAEERLRFARDLHDVAGRTLSVVALKAELAAQFGKRGRPEAVEEMLEVRRIAQESLAELRAVVSGLRSAKLDEELAGARSLLDAAGITCRVVGDSGGLAPRTRATLGWAIREATTNVLRHSRATECMIDLNRTTDGAVVLTMTNDGAGSAWPAHGNGLTGLAERVAQAGGTVDAGPVPPDGFRVAVRLPSPAREPSVKETA